MNIAVADAGTGLPSPRQLMEQALAPHVLLGMPHLTPSGLSETWLMKELGHRHWLLLARRLGMDDADFRTPAGDEAYAAICATSLESEGLAALRANDVLTIRSDLLPVSRARFESRHRLFCGSRCIGRVSLVSAFVSRGEGRGNRSIARTVIGAPGPAFDAGDGALIRLASDLKAGRSDLFPGIDLATAPPRERLAFIPSVSQEFNGAGLFYFAEFQALAERAAEQRHSPLARHPVTRRDIVFLGNIEPGDTISLDLIAQTDDRATSGCRITAADGSTLAIMATKRLL